MNYSCKGHDGHAQFDFLRTSALRSVEADCFWN